MQQNPTNSALIALLGVLLDTSLRQIHGLVSAGIGHRRVVGQHFDDGDGLVSGSAVVRAVGGGKRGGRGIAAAAD